MTWSLHADSSRCNADIVPANPAGSIGSRNQHFGSVAATLYSLIASAERPGVDPQRYLTCVLANIAPTPVNELHRFLPDVWAAAEQAEPDEQLQHMKVI